MKSKSHIRKAFATLAVASAVIMPLGASAQTVTPAISVASLQQQLQNLLAQLSALQEAATKSVSTQVTMPSSVSSAQSGIICPTFVRTLARGSSGTDVANLQGFLAQNPLIYPEAAVTAYFGMLTQDAVQRWQSAYHIVTSGTPATTGYGVVGPRTAAAITASCMNQSASSDAAAETATTSAQQPLCPIASEPATPCVGTWSPLTNATGCTIAWQCAVPLPGAAAASGSVSSAADASATPACPAYTLPLCTDGTDQWLGIGSNGCNLGYQCFHPGQ